MHVRSLKFGHGMIVSPHKPKRAHQINRASLPTVIKGTGLLLIPLVAASAWPSVSFAQRQTAVGPGSIPLSATGGLNGVDMSASATTGTLVVGVPGGPTTDIFTLNKPPVAGFVAVSTAASSQGNILFNSGSTVYGAVGATQPAGPFLLNIRGGATGTAVNFQGPVFATTLDVSGAGAVNFNSGSTNVTATNFAGDGSINLAPNTTLIGALTTTAGANTGTLGLGAASTLNGAVGGAVGLRAINVVGGSNLAGVTATITGAANAYSFSLGTNTLNVGGALTIANGGPAGVVNTTLASQTLYGNIRPVGVTNLGPALRVNVTVPSTAFIPVGSQFNIIQTRTGTTQSGTNGSVVTVTVQDPTNPLYTFTAVPAAGTVAGLVTIKTTGIPLLVPIAPPPDTALPPIAPVAVPIVPVLVALAPAPGAPEGPSQLVDVLAPIGALSDPAAVVNAVAQLSPASSGLAAPLVTFQGSQQFQNLLLSRLDSPLCDDISRPDQEPERCKGAERRSGAWIKAFGYAGDEGAKSAFTGYTANIVGTMIGYDAPVSPETRVGLALGYARSTINAKVFSNKTQFDTYDATIYAAHEQGPWYINGNLSYGWNDYTGSRSVSFPGLSRTAQASYSGQAYTAFATTGYHIPIQGLTITPLASLQYTHVKVGSYGESGGGDINLAVGSRSYDFLESGLGVKVAHDFKYADVTYVPDLHTKWFHELNNPTMTQTAAFRLPGSSSFTTPGFRPAGDTFNIGAGVTILTCACASRKWSLEAIYDYYWRTDNYSAHQGTLRLSTRF
jgi:outer membrane autotransporter protein